jgi:capsid protein
MDMMVERMAGGSALSKQRLTGDAAGANFASIKASQEDDARVISPIQKHVISQTIVPIRKRFTSIAIGTRRISSISAQQYRNQRFRFNAIRATFPGIVSSDPLADAEAAGARMRMGLSSPIQEAARIGHDFYEMIDETAEANAYAKKNLVVMDLSKGQGVPLERSSTERPTEAEKQKEAERNAPAPPRNPTNR